MPRKKKPTTLDAAIKELQRALKTLDPEHGIVGRRNSRKRVSAAMRTLQGIVDADYPAIRKKAKPRRRLSHRDKCREAERKGFKEVSPAHATIYASAGVSVKFIRTTTPRFDRAGKRLPATSVVASYVPGWAYAVGPHPRDLRKFGKNTQRKQAARAIEGLTKQHAGNELIVTPSRQIDKNTAAVALTA